MTTQKVFKVISGPLSIRVTPNGDPIQKKFKGGDEFIAEPGSATKEGDYMWWKHADGWTAEFNLNTGERLLLDISDRDPNAPREFKVVFNGLSVRDRPNGLKGAKKIPAGTVLQFDPKSVTEGGIVWWKFADGWLPERKATGAEVYMREVFTVPRLGKDGKPLQPIKIGDEVKQRGKVAMQVAKVEQIRYDPAQSGYLRNLKRGETLECDMSTLKEVDGYYWLKHQFGWTKWQDIYGEDMVMGEPGTIPGLIAVGMNGPKKEDLPGIGQLITRIPVDIPSIHYFQYYGNNVFALAVAGKMYDYSQGMHGGLDFGIWNSDPANIPVYAGIEGKFLKVEYSKDKRNDRVFIQRDDYLFIYQHVTNMVDMPKGKPVTPDTQLAVIHHESQGGWNHLHFEVRFMETWILNPLWFMTQPVLDSILTAFPPDKPNISWKKTSSVYNFFYKAPDWDKWTTPLDQPVLKLNGPRIGPSVGKK